MFIGYEIKSQQNQAKPLVLETDIKLSQAALDPSKAKKSEPVSLMVEYDGKQFILAVLDPSRSWQCALDLMFAAGSEVKFFLRGTGSVHLTGFECRDDMRSDLEFDTSSDEELSIEEDHNEEEVERPKHNNKRPLKAIEGPKTNGVSKVAKKDEAKKPANASNDNSDEDDSDDEDFDSDMMEDEELSMSDESEGELDQFETDSDDDEEDEVEEDDDDEDEDEY